MGDKVNQAKAQRGIVADTNAGLAYLLLNLFGFSLVTNALIQSEFNKMTAQN